MKLEKILGSSKFIDKLKDGIDMLVINKNSIEVPESYRARLSQDKGYRKLTKQLLKLVDDYNLVDDCFEYCAQLVESLEGSPVTIDDALHAIKRTYPFSEKPEQNDLYTFSKRILSPLIKSENRNTFYGSLEELEKAIVIFEIDAKFRTHMAFGIKVSHKNVMINWEWVTDYLGFEKKAIQAYEDLNIKINNLHDFFEFYAYPKEIEQLDKARVKWIEVYNNIIGKLEQRMADKPIPRNYHPE